MVQFTDIQLEQMVLAGIQPDEIIRQIARFETGMVHVILDRPATAGDGIMVFHEDQLQSYVHKYKDSLSELKVCKFVPASGAATRMFKDLFEFLTLSAEAAFDQLPASVRAFAHHFSSFAFADDLIRLSTANLGRTPDAENVADLQVMVRLLLTDAGLNYGALPKAMLSFHHYGDFSRWAFEEHLVEAAMLAEDLPKAVSIHFTLSPNHVTGFEVLLNKALPEYSAQLSKSFEVSWSVQNSATDTVAVGETNAPLTDELGRLLLRPGGHGALLFNLNNLDADVIFIRNIDNIAVESIERSNIVWKQLLGGLLIHVQSKVHGFLAMMHEKSLDSAELEAAADCIRQSFNVSFDLKLPHVQDEMFRFLNRPIRVCGMVKNTGEPGGGPFWVRTGEGVSLQIVESAQINMSDPVQKQIAMSATHFNPVDLVCGVRDFKGKSFDLNDFVDPETSFISIKSHQGKVLKALEHPGLWNGAMANWLTLFVEVPLITFNPVKTVNDLLRPEHQSRK